jgi:hypothetical protein
MIWKSGQVIFITQVPVIESIWLLAKIVKGGNSAKNEYGSSPKADDIVSQ